MQKTSTPIRIVFNLHFRGRFLLLLVLLLGLSSGRAQAQLTESFADGDFTQNPVWTGGTADFQVNASQQLQSNGPAVTPSTTQLVTVSQAATGTTWEFYAKLNLATSGSNYADVWLMADQADLKAATTKGYFVRLGGTDDEVSLFRKNPSATAAVVIDGANSTLSSTSSNVVRVRVTRSVQNVWTLERDLTGGTTFTTEGTATDATHQRSSYLGVTLTYSATNNRNFYFDDFRVTDATAPTLLSAGIISARQVDVVFNELVAATQTPASYTLTSAGAPAVTAAQRDATDPALVHLTLAADLPAGSSTLAVRNVADLYGNVAGGPLTATLTYTPPAVTPGYYQLLITEILADELPVVGLPASEFVEIHNPSATQTLDLGGVRLLRTSSTATAAVFPTGAQLLPGEYAVVCGSTRTAQFASYGKVFGLSNFPALTNAGDELLLRARDGRTVFEVRYTDAWYRDAVKKEGGWTLEMIDTANPCGGAANWTASTDASGGTPGRANSARAANADRTAPLLRRATVVSPTLVRLEFDEKLDSVTASNPALYSLTPGLTITRVTPVPFDFRAVELTLATPLAAAQAYTATVQRSVDCVGNATGAAASVTFGLPVVPTVGQVLITEIMADETPTVGLPASEYLEIHNPTTRILDLGGMRLLKPGSSSAAVFPDTTRLQPGQYAVVCSSTRTALFARYGAVFGVSNFPSLSNDGDQLVLRARDGRTLFEIAYSSTWYKDAAKKDGGWALEMVDTGNPCAGIENWTASTDPSGGTPGKVNAARATNPDRTAPALLRAVAISPTIVRLYFGEKLDSVAAANPALYSFSTGPTVTKAAPASPDFRAVDLTLGSALVASQPITVSVQRATDCVGNATGAAASATFGLPSAPVENDVVINEILFNPRTGGVDFVELLNRSNKYLNLQGWELGNISTSNVLSKEPITAGPYVLAPGQLVVLTTKPDVVQSQYPTNDPSAFLTLPALPTFADDAGTVVVFDSQNRALDRYAYSESQHLGLLDSKDGVSLERIRTDGPSVAGNFHSAASAVGYASPGRRNSQYQDDPGGDKLFTLEPEVFTPDADGQQDFTTLNYRVDQPGFAASITVYDAQGRLARRLVRNETMATTGFFQWDGLNDQGRKVPIGYYVLHIELLQPSGEKKDYKKTVVVGARF
ncbi:lamin tail domain-containing protein [Hymenobacter chitinivorans]|uniref:Lamin tail-like protein n=1 Tax=Hymenobacter chitinivorans DSM 11115 TaxID=1121954 RepID=A0A2M9B9C9_9BACT|nr:lamin tail domain-containing protein [Hymenobacter chitinivorans]PJJ54552.1 lamin tail-like protein [Hymenobacter chitinivorans DSM 11115]